MKEKIFFMVQVTLTSLSISSLVLGLVFIEYLELIGISQILAKVSLLLIFYPLTVILIEVDNDFSMRELAYKGSLLSLGAGSFALLAVLLLIKFIVDNYIPEFNVSTSYFEIICGGVFMTFLLRSFKQKINRVYTLILISIKN